jgi:PAS domain S-box-containing protein
MDTSVPRQRDASDAVLVDMLTLEAPVGLALFGPDLRFRWVNAALVRLGENAEAVPLDPEALGSDALGSEVLDPEALDPEVPAVAAPAHPSACHGLLPSEAWPGPVAARAEAALRKVLDEDAPLTETGYPAVPASRDPAAPGEPPAEDVSGCASWYPVHDAAGQVLGIGLILLNVAGPSAEAAEAAAAAAAEIRRSEERYRSLVQGGAQVVWVAAADGSMKEDSPEWRWITGQSQEQYTGFGWLDAVHPEDRERVERDWRECVRTGKICDDRYRIRTKGGSYRHYDVRAVPIERDGKIAEWVGACTDVTSQREAEEMRGRLTEQLSAAALRTARLQQATSMLAEALTVEQVVEVITEVGRTAIGALRSAVVLLDGARLRVVNDDLRDAPDSAGGDLTLETPSVMTRAISTRRPVLVEDPEDLRRQFDGELVIDPERVALSDERSWVGLPLLAAGAPLGALRFSFARPRKITEEERVFLEALAGQCSLAVERAGLYEREHTTAETLQRSLLPDQLPTLPRLVLEATYRPVTKNMEIGGDWYDAFRLADQRLALALGDVMGKGLTAAAGMGRVRNALRALALTDPRPAAVLGGLDRLFAATEQEEQVTTVAYLVIDPETGDGVLGNAGHLPALVLQAGCAPRFDGVEAGTPLGWASPRKQHAFNLRPGSTAVFYSDGLVENRNRGLDAGLEELAAVAGRADEELLARPERFLEYLVERMLAGHEQDDDVTVLVMHVPADGPR